MIKRVVNTSGLSSWHLLLFCLLSWTISGQEDRQFDHVVAINSDNDAFAAARNKDRYYSFGLGASLAFKSEKFLGLQHWIPRKESFFLRARLRMEGYTPSVKVVTLPQLAGDSTITFDRPFAGLLHGSLESTHILPRSFLRTSLLLGIMGPSSGAGELQRWIHDNVTEDDVFDAWRFQLPDQLLLNVSGTYLYDLTPQANWAGIYGSMEARLGNLYIDTTPTLGLRIGRFNGINKTAALGNELLAGKGDWELYLHSTFSATWALFNATAQGRLFGPAYEYALEDINPFFLSMSHGIYFTYKRVVFGYDHFFRYGEVVEGEQHVYARLDFRYRF